MAAAGQAVRSLPIQTVLGSCNNPITLHYLYVGSGLEKKHKSPFQYTKPSSTCREAQFPPAQLKPLPSKVTTPPPSMSPSIPIHFCWPHLTSPHGKPLQGLALPQALNQTNRTKGDKKKPLSFLNQLVPGSHTGYQLERYNRSSDQTQNPQFHQCTKPTKGSA